jgi:photosystem II stability/assembly factor-like uncharacterized protein
MNNRIFVFAGADGLTLFEREKDAWREAGKTLTGHHFTSVARGDHYLLAGTTDGIFRSVDSGRTWWEVNAGLTNRHIRWLARHPDHPEIALAGTEPAAIFVSHDGGENWRDCPEVVGLRERFGWSLPYSPEAGCVRGFAFHGLRAYAAVEQGGLLRSNNRGGTWHLVPGSSGDPNAPIPDSFIHPDVHSVAVHPSSPEQVFAPTGGGLYHSSDGGTSWELLYRCYCRAVWVDPVTPDHLILGPADSVDSLGRIEESVDGGTTWRPITSGLEAPWPRHMVERFVPVEGELLAVLSNGQVVAASLETLVWRNLEIPAEGIKTVTFVSG